VIAAKVKSITTADGMRAADPALAHGKSLKTTF
jgi:hypothetical protein